MPHVSRRRLCAITLCLAALAIAVAPGCGGGKDGKDVTALLDKAFGRSISSADVNMDVEVELKGVESLEDPIRLKVKGPYRTGGRNRIPSLDVDLDLNAGGQSFKLGLISTGDRAFVTYQDTAYEVPPGDVTRINSQIAQANARSRKRSLGDFGVDARRWVKDAEEKGDEDVAGVETTHVRGALDVGRVLQDLNRLVERASGSFGGQAPPKLTALQRRQIESVVKDPTFDVYVGKDDDRIRRLSFDLEIDVPASQRKAARGIERGRVSFSIEFAKVGAKQKIQAPARARALSELAGQLTGLGALGGASSGTPDATQGSSGSSNSSSRPDAKKFEEYDRCLDKAEQSDLEALRKCSAILN